MNRRVLFDTNAYSRLARGDEAVLDVLGGADVVFASVFVLGELLAGFRSGKKEAKNREILASFLENPTVRILMATERTAEFFGAVKHRLRLQGTPIPTGDIWIAAHALETDAALVTFDAHFHKVEGLRCCTTASSR